MINSALLGSIVFVASDTFQNTYDRTPGGNVIELANVQMKDSTRT